VIAGLSICHRAAFLCSLALLGWGTAAFRVL